MNAKNLFRIVCSTLVAGALLFTACKKESKAFKESTNPDENVKNVMVNAKLVNEFTIEDMQTYTEETQRLIFKELTPENRARLVKERIDFAINLETNSTNIEMLNTVKGMINSSQYDEDGNASESSAIRAYSESMIPVLGYEKMKNIGTTWGATGSYFVSINSNGNATTTTTTTVGGATPTCSCNRSEDFCLPGASCKIICELDRGCGWWWNNACDGKCGWN